MNIGDRVSWQSQAGGVWIKKTGVIAYVIPAGVRPSKVADVKQCRASFSLRADLSQEARKEESYLVAVPPNGESNAKWRLYWPRTSALRPG